MTNYLFLKANPNIKNPQPFESFLSCFEIFLKNLRIGIHRLKETKDINHDLGTVYLKVWKETHLRCWILEWILKQHRENKVSYSKVEKTFDFIISFLELATVAPGHLDSEMKAKLDESHQTLLEHPDLGNKLLIVKDTVGVKDQDLEKVWNLIHRDDEPWISWNPQRKAPPSVPQSGQLSDLTQSQGNAYNKLVHFYKIRTTQSAVAGIQTRAIPLILGASGVGKSSLIKHFCIQQNVPLLGLECGCWLLNGAKESPHTLDVIANFVKSNEQGVLFIDELDKFTARGDWNNAIQQEVFALLDGRLDAYPSWDQNLIQKLETSFLIIGAGTWQKLYQQIEQPLGFCVKEEKRSILDQIQEQESIPQELLFRFNANLIEIHGPSVKEFGLRIIKIHQELGLKIPSKDDLLALGEKAFGSRKNNRWLEAYLTEKLFHIREVKEANIVTNIS